MNTTAASQKPTTLLEVLDRVLEKGVVVSGDIALSVADIDLIYLDLRLLLGSVETIQRFKSMPPAAQVFPALTTAPPVQGSPEISKPETQPIVSKPETQASASKPETQAGAVMQEETGANKNKIVEEVAGETDRLLMQMENVQGGFPKRINANPDDAEKGLMQLALTIIELLRRLMEKQAMRRIDAGSLTEAESERMGVAFMRLESKMKELQAQFGIKDEDLNLNLGPLGDLM